MPDNPFVKITREVLNEKAATRLAAEIGARLVSDFTPLVEAALDMNYTMTMSQAVDMIHKMTGVIWQERVLRRWAAHPTMKPNSAMLTDFHKACRKVRRGKRKVWRVNPVLLARAIKPETMGTPRRP